MKTTNIIIALIISTTLFACNDNTVYVDEKVESIKGLDLEVNLSEVFAMPDGRAAALVNPNRQRYGSEAPYTIAVMDKNGTYILSETFFLYNKESYEEDSLTASNHIYITSSGEFFVKQHISNLECDAIRELNKYGDLIYQDESSGFRRNSDESGSSVFHDFYTKLDSDEIAIIRMNISQTLTSEYCLKFLDNYYKESREWKGSRYDDDIEVDDDKFKAFTYKIETEGNFFCTNVVSFDNRIILYNEYYPGNIVNDDEIELQNDCNEYYILNTDGTSVNSGKCELPIIYVKHVDDNIYIITSDIAYKGTSDVYKWCITKMDKSGNAIYTSAIDTYSLLGNITIDNGTLMIPGLAKNNKTKRGAIFLLDDNNSGTVKGKIELDYNQYAVMPCVITPDDNGEYDIFALVQHDYTNSNGNTDEISGKLFVYHTDDLRKLQLNDH